MASRDLILILHQFSLRPSLLKMALRLLIMPRSSFEIHGGSDDFLVLVLCSKHSCMQIVDRPVKGGDRIRGVSSLFYLGLCLRSEPSVKFLKALLVLPAVGIPCDPIGGNSFHFIYSKHGFVVPLYPAFTVNRCHDASHDQVGQHVGGNDV